LIYCFGIFIRLLYWDPEFGDEKEVEESSGRRYILRRIITLMVLRALRRNVVSKE
jgi:hypothetical protein